METWQFATWWVFRWPRWTTKQLVKQKRIFWPISGWRALLSGSRLRQKVLPVSQHASSSHQNVARRWNIRYGCRYGFGRTTRAPRYKRLVLTETFCEWRGSLAHHSSAWFFLFWCRVRCIARGHEHYSFGKSIFFLQVRCWVRYHSPEIKSKKTYIVHLYCVMWYAPTTSPGS